MAQSNNYQHQETTVGTVIGTIAGIVFGGLISLGASSFYYRKALKQKKLSCYVQFVSEILKGIDPDVKEKLKIVYDRETIENIYQIQFVIANTGDIAITNPLRPLTLLLNDDSCVLDYSVIHKDPKGRDITIQIDKKNTVVLNFILLNPGEYFVIKLLVRGTLPSLKEENEEDEFQNFMKNFEVFKFCITSEDLPPEIYSERLPYDYIESNQLKYNKEILVFGGIMGAIAGILAVVLSSFNFINREYFLFNFKNYFTNFNIIKFCILLCWLLTGLFVFLTFAMPFNELKPFIKKKRNRIKIPKDISKSSSQRKFIY